MDFFKKISPFILWIFLASVIITGFVWFYSMRKVNTDPLSLLPVNTAAIIDCADLRTGISGLTKDNLIWKEFSASGLFDESEISLIQADSILKVQPDLIPGKRLIISVSVKANNSPGVLYCLPLTVKRGEDVLLKSAGKYLDALSYSKRRFEGYSIYDLSWKSKSGKSDFSIVNLKGILLGSFSPELIEAAIIQFKTSVNITSQSDFEDVLKTSGGAVPIKVYVNYKALSDILTSIFTAKPEDFKGLENFASWGSSDADFSGNKLVLNGFSSIYDSIRNAADLYYKQEPIEISGPEVLPDGTGFFKAWGFSDKDIFFNRLSHFFNTDPGFSRLATLKKSLFTDFQIDLDKGFKEMISNEYGVAYMQSGRISFPFFYMKLKSQSLAEQQFLDWLSLWTIKTGKDLREFSMDYKIDNNNTIKIYKMPVGGIPSMVFGPSFTSPGNDYFTFINNYLVFADSFNSIKEFVYNVILGNTLNVSPSFTSLGDNISSRCNFFIFARPAIFENEIDERLSHTWKPYFDKGKEAISKIDAMSMQFSSADNLLYHHIFLNYSGKPNGIVNTIWKSRIDTATVFKPVVVVNHLTSEKEILIQDLSNQLYLLSNAGIILWKVKLESEINSEVFQIDYYKNGKLQYLFSTQDKIYLIDRNGNPVENFPVILRSPSTAGISLFDYDKDGTIRICVPGEDRKIYMYDKNGKLITGWQAKPTDNIVKYPIQHFRVGDKDYIIAIDQFKFYIFDRKGNNRVALKDYFQVSENNCFYLDESHGAARASLVTTDTSGNILRVYFNGKVEKVLKRSLDSKHYFIFADIDGDQKPEYITAFGNKLEVMNNGPEQRFLIEMPDKITFKPILYKFSSTNTKIGIVLSEPGNIYLYNNDGSLYKGFPLEGSAQFSISSFPELEGRFNMIVGTKNNFLFNYSVQ